MRTQVGAIITAAALSLAGCSKTPDPDASGSQTPAVANSIKGLNYSNAHAALEAHKILHGVTVELEIFSGPGPEGRTLKGEWVTAKAAELRSLAKEWIDRAEPVNARAIADVANRLETASDSSGPETFPEVQKCMEACEEAMTSLRIQINAGLESRG